MSGIPVHNALRCAVCGEPFGRCDWEVHHAWDPRLRAAFGRHDPPIDPAEVRWHMDAWREGCLIDVCVGRQVVAWIYFDAASGQVFNAPAYIDNLEEMREFLADAGNRAELTLWTGRT